MGQGQEIKTRSDSQVEIQERGEIFFFYRPKVEREEAHGADDVQRLYIVMRPESGERAVEEKQDSCSGKEAAKSSPDRSPVASSSRDSTGGGHGSQKVNIEKEALLRFIVMGRKSLPDTHKKGQPYWGFVDLVTTNIDDIKAALQGEEYDTETKGHRHVYPARAVGEGIYRILRHNSDGKRKRMHTHLVYKLEFPSEDKENGPQKSLNIEEEASFIIQIKNPDQQGSGSRSTSSGFRGLQNKRKAVFPANLQGQIGHSRFCPADPPDFLNYEGCEFLLIAASDDIDEELGIELKGECETDPACSDLLKTFGSETVSPTPLLEGNWA